MKRTAPPPPVHRPGGAHRRAVGERSGAGRSTRNWGPRVSGSKGGRVFGGYGSLSPTQPTPSPLRGASLPLRSAAGCDQMESDGDGAKTLRPVPGADGGAYKWAGVRPGTACAAAGSDLRRDEPPLLLPNELLTHPTPPPPDLVGLGSARPPRAAAAAAGEHPSPLLSFAPVREAPAPAPALCVRSGACLPASSPFGRRVLFCFVFGVARRFRSNPGSCSAAPQWWE
jgi:hypothetical protein